MNPINAYKFCPRCSGSLNIQKENLLVCSKCSFELYINPSPCNAIIIENENQEIMLVKRKFAPQKGFWDLPGGFINAYETLEESVNREIKEELGVEIEITNTVGVYKDLYEFQNIKGPVLSVVVSARITKGQVNVSDDINGFKYFPKEEILNQKLAFDSMRQGLLDYLKNS